MSGPRFVRFYPSDWRSGCIGMTFEQEGFYIRVCAFIYESNRRLPLNDSEAAKLIGANTNAYRKLKNQLVELGKLKHTADGYTVPRAERELASVAHAKREQERPADPVRGRNTRPDTLTDAGEDTPLDTPLEFSEKPQKINDPLKSHNQNHNRNITQPSELVTADGRAEDPFLMKCKAALNGTTERAIEIVRQADGVYGTKAGAAQWLAELIDDTSADAVIQAIRFAEAKRDRREVVANPKALIAKTAQTARANAMQPTEAKPVSVRDTRPAWVIEKEQRRKAFLTAIGMEPAA